MSQEEKKRGRKPGDKPAKVPDTHRGTRWRQCYTESDFDCIQNIMEHIGSPSRAVAIRYAIKTEIDFLSNQKQRAESAKIAESVSDLKRKVAAGVNEGGKLTLWSFWAYKETFDAIDTILKARKLQHKAEAVRFAIQSASAHLGKK